MDFLMEHEHPHMYHDFEHMKIAMAQYYASLLTKLKDHIDDRNVHVTLEEKERWNKKADGLSLEELEMKLLKKANISDIPTLISELKNDVPYLTADTLKTILAGLDYITWADLKYKDYITTDEVNRLIRNIVIDPFDERLSGFVRREDLATINNQKLYLGGNIDITSIVEQIINNGIPGSNNTDLSGYVAKGSLLGTINGVQFYQGTSINIGSGTGSQGSGSSSYTLPIATTSTLGGIKLGGNGGYKTYPVQLDQDNKAYVYVPWVDPSSSSSNPEYTVYHYQVAYKAGTSTIPTLPTNGLPGVDNGWQLNSAPNNIGGNQVIWMTQRTVDNRNSYGMWLGPWRISGPGGENGADAEDIDYIYRLTTSEAFPEGEETPNEWAIEQQNTHSNVIPTPAIKRSDVWTDNPQGIDSINRYEWMCLRTKPRGTNTQWGRFTSPILWSAYGKTGLDGDGIEYIFYTHIYNAASPSPNFEGVNDPTSWTTDPDFQNREYYKGSWSDDPDDLEDLPAGSKIYVSIRRKYADDIPSPEAEGAYWHAYSEPSLWSSTGRDGTVEGASLSNSNPTIPVNFDDNGRNLQFTEQSILRAYNGNQPLTINSVSIGTIKDEKGNTVSGISVTTPSGQSTTKTITVSSNEGSFIIKDKLITIPIVVNITINGQQVDQDTTIQLYGIKIGSDGCTYNLVLNTYQMMLKKDGTQFVPSEIIPKISVVKGTTDIEQWTPSMIGTNAAQNTLKSKFDIQYKLENSNNWQSFGNSNSITPTVPSSFPFYINVRIFYDNTTVVDTATVLLLDKIDVPAPAVTYQIIPTYSSLIREEMSPVNGFSYYVKGQLSFYIQKTENTEKTSIVPNKVSVKVGNRSAIISTNGSTVSNGGLYSLSVSNSFDQQSGGTKSIYTFNSSGSDDDTYLLDGQGFVSITAYDSTDWELASITVPVIIPGKDATQQALIGKVSRQRGAWQTPAVDPPYSDGLSVSGDGNAYIDVVTYGNDFYMCVNSINANMASKGNPSENNGWLRLTNIGSVFAYYLQANAAFIKNLTSNEIVVTDGNNNIVAGMTSGNKIPTAIAENVDNTNNIRIWAGPFDNANIASAPFTVDSDGNVKLGGNDYPTRFRNDGVAQIHGDALTIFHSDTGNILTIGSDQTRRNSNVQDYNAIYLGLSNVISRFNLDVQTDGEYSQLSNSSLIFSKGSFPGSQDSNYGESRVLIDHSGICINNRLGDNDEYDDAIIISSQESTESNVTKIRQTITVYKNGYSYTGWTGTSNGLRFINGICVGPAY